MTRIFRILLGLISAVIVLSVLAAVLLPLIYDKDDLKRAIAAEVHQQTGRELSIDGALDFSVFPWLALEVSDLSLGNAEGFGDQPFARIGQARVGVALMPLFRKQIAVGEITLDGLELDLAVNAQGDNNWTDLSGSSEAETVPSSEAGSSPFTSQRVAGLTIRESRIDFQDQQAGSHYRLSEFSMQTGVLAEGESVPVELTTLLEDLTSGKLTAVEMATTVTVDFPAQQYIFTGFELALTGETADSNGKDQPVRIKAPRVSADLAAQTLQIDAFEAELAVLRADGTLSASNILDDPAFSGTFKAAEFSPAGLMQALQMDVPATADPDALKRAAVRTAFSGNSSHLNLHDFELELDQSHFTGELIVQNFARPKIDFELAADAIDLDRYLEPSSDASVQENVAIPQEELRGEEVNGQLSVGKLSLAGLNFSDARIGIAIRDGKLRVNPLTANFYGGTYNGDITLDSSGAIPVISLNEKIDSVTFQQLVSDLVDSEALSGMALGHLRVTGSGANSDEVLRSLNGDLGLTLTEGALEGINIWHEIRRGMALYKGLEPPPAEPDRTVFSRMKLAATIENGVVNTRELLGELPFLTIQGSGTVDLGQSMVDMELLAAVRNVPELANDPLGAELTGKSLPFKLSGSLDDPSVAVDFEALLKSEATQMLLDKLGFPPAAESQEGADAEQKPASTEDQLKKAAEGALFDLLRGKDKEKDKNDM